MHKKKIKKTIVLRPKGTRGTRQPWSDHENLVITDKPRRLWLRACFARESLLQTSFFFKRQWLRVWEARGSCLDKLKRQWLSVAYGKAGNGK